MSGIIENETRSELNSPEAVIYHINLLRNLAAISSVYVFIYDAAAGRCWYAGTDADAAHTTDSDCLAELFFEDDLPAVRAYLESMGVDGHKTASPLYCLYRKPGTEFWIRGALKATVLSHSGHHAPLLLVAVEQESVEEDDTVVAALEQRELSLESEQMMHFGTYNWNLADQRIFWSDGLYSVFGQTKQTLLTLDIDTYMSFVAEEDRQQLQDAVAHVLADVTETEVEYRVHTGYGSIKTVCMMLRPVSNQQQVPVRIIGTIRDITSLKDAEEQLAKHVEELSRSNKELEEFAYVASHDLQEPLRKISTFTDRIVGKYNEHLDDEGRLYLKRILASTQNMRLLIDNLLEFSRITRQPYSYVSTNLGTLVSDVRKDLDLTIEETGGALQIGKLPVIEAIPGQMKQLFNNLLSNAFKFRKENQPPVIAIESAVATEEEKQKHGLPQDKTYHTISVTDNGIGFEEEYATRIFQIFQRLHGKSEYPGTGIGLAICKKIAEHHNGVIFAENIPGQGARFTAILPEHQNSRP